MEDDSAQSGNVRVPGANDGSGSCGVVVSFCLVEEFRSFIQAFGFAVAPGGDEPGDGNPARIV